MEVFTVNKDILNTLFLQTGANKTQIAAARRYARDPEYFAKTEGAVEKLVDATIRMGYMNAMKKVFATFESALYTRLAYYTPVDTGNLLGSVYAKQSGSYAVQIGFDTNKAPYAHKQHELDFKHPHGGQKSYLMDAVTDAWQSTLIAALDEPNDAMSDGMQMVLGGMHYFVDTDRHKMAVTINGKYDNMSSMFDQMDVDSAAEQQLIDNLNQAIGRATLGNNAAYYKKATDMLSDDGLMALQAYYAADRQNALYDDNDELPNKTAKTRFENLNAFTEAMTGMDTDTFFNFAMTKANPLEQQQIMRLTSMSPGIDPTRLAFERYMSNTRIIYPLFIDQAERAAKRKEREAERELEAAMKAERKAERDAFREQREINKAFASGKIQRISMEEYMRLTHDTEEQYKSADSMLETDIEKATDV